MKIWRVFLLPPFWDSPFRLITDEVCFLLRIYFWSVFNYRWDEIFIDNCQISLLILNGFKRIDFKRNRSSLKFVYYYKQHECLYQQSIWFIQEINEIDRSGDYMSLFKEIFIVDVVLMVCCVMSTRASDSRFWSFTNFSTVTCWNFQKMFCTLCSIIVWMLRVYHLWKNSMSVDVLKLDFKMLINE